MSAQLIDGAIVFRAGMNIDGDGSPRCYHPDSAPGLDHLRNAGEPGDWYGIVCDDWGRPVVQGPKDPAPGFYVSPTALCDRRFGREDPRRYVDSEKVPYVSVSPELRVQGARLGDLALVFYGAGECAALVADVGPKGKLGEGSIALAKELGIPSSPRNGGVSKPIVSYVIFAGSVTTWPRPLDEVQVESVRRFVAWGGLSRLAQALG